MIQAGTASQTQAMPVVKLREQSAAPDPAGTGIRGPHRAHRAAGRGQGSDVEPQLPGQSRPLRREVSLATRTMDTEVDVPNPACPDTRDVCRSEPHSGSSRQGAGDPGHGGGHGQLRCPARRRANRPSPDRHAQHRVEKRKVILGIESPKNVEVRSGLNEGDSVVLSGRSTLQPGQEVRPKVTTMSAKSL